MYALQLTTSVRRRRPRNPALRVTLIILFIILVALGLSYVCCVGTRRPFTDVVQHHDYLWIVYGLIVGALFIGFLGAFCPSTLPLAEVGGHRTEAFVGNTQTSESYGLRENLYPTDDWTQYVRHHASTDNFTVETGSRARARAPFVSSNTSNNTNGEDTDILVQHLSAQAHVDLPLQPLNEYLHQRKTNTSNEANPSSGERAYLFRIWVTAKNESLLHETIHPFDLRYTRASRPNQSTTGREQGLHVTFRVLQEPDTTHRQIGGQRWYHLESSKVMLPQDARAVYWRIGTLASACTTRKGQTGQNTSNKNAVRYWCGFEITHYREGLANEIEPSAELQALYSTFLTPNPFSQNKRAWLDTSGHHHSSEFVNRGVVLHDNGGISLRTTQPLWHGPSSSVLLGDLRTQDSQSNHVTPFTISFLYTPAYTEVLKEGFQNETCNHKHSHQDGNKLMVNGVT